MSNYIFCWPNSTPFLIDLYTNIPKFLKLNVRLRPTMLKFREEEGDDSVPEKFYVVLEMFT
jgi:hypothetical protein